MDNLEIYEKVRSVPDNAKKPIKGGRLNGMTDINPVWRIKTLTEQFGPCGIGWYYEVTKKWTESAGSEIAAFVDIEMYIKNGNEWSKPIHGTGGSMFVAKERNGIHVSDECYKMALTDAISVACKQLGVGADVYWDADQTKYNSEEDSPPVSLKTNVYTSPKVNNEQINDLLRECERTGKPWRAICGMYGVDQFSNMNFDQYKDCMSRFKNTPDKTLNNPPDNSADTCGLNFS